MLWRAGHGSRKTALPVFREAGFTLLEILIVLTIIALVAAFVGPRLMAQLDRSKVTAAKVQIRSLTSSLETMRLDLGRYPTEAEGLVMLVEAPSPTNEDAALWQGPYLETDVPNDPWGRAYVYRAPATLEARPLVISLGADGAEGGTGNAADLFFGKRSENATR